jgi:hypothetical protein
MTENISKKDRLKKTVKAAVPYIAATLAGALAMAIVDGMRTTTTIVNNPCTLTEEEAGRLAMHDYAEQADEYMLFEPSQNAAISGKTPSEIMEKIESNKTKFPDYNF